MFENLTGRLAGVIKTLRGEARLTESNIQQALREIRLALLAIIWMAGKDRHSLDANGVCDIIAGLYWQ